MSRYIDADVLRKQAEDIIGDNAGHKAWAILSAIAMAPTADVVPVVHGIWKRISPAKIYECSKCGKNVMTDDIEAYTFCHGCGARMEGAEE